MTDVATSQAPASEIWIETLDDLIDALGGRRTVAEIVGVGGSAVSMWKVRGALPDKASIHNKLRRAAQDKQLKVRDSVWATDTAAAA